MHKYDADYEHKIVLMAQNRVETGRYKIFDRDARVVTKMNFPELVTMGKTDFESCLIIASRDGETVVITKEFSRILYNALKAEN